MASIITLTFDESYLNTNLKILDGDTIVFEPYPFDKYPELVSSKSSYLVNAYRLLDVKFPNLDRLEPYSSESKQGLISILKTGAFNVLKLGHHNQFFKSKNITITKTFKWVYGTIKLPGIEDIKEGGRYFIVSPNDKTLPYYIYANKIYRLQLQQIPTTPNVTEKNNIWVGAEITDSLQLDGILVKDLDIASLTMDLQSAQTYSSSDIFPKSTTIDNPNVTLNVVQTITINVYNVLIYRETLANLESDLFNVTNNINFNILKNGIGYYKSNDAGLVDADSAVETIDTNTLRKNFNKEITLKISENPNPIQTFLGMWNNEYWKKVRVNYSKDIALLSWSTLKVFHTCKFKYFHTIYNHPARKIQDIINEDKDTILDWDNQKQFYRGTIIHRMNEIVLQEIMKTNPRTYAADSIVEEIVNIGRAHLRGERFEKHANYQFTKKDLQAVSIDEHDLNTVNFSLFNVNHRTLGKAKDSGNFYTNFKKVATEVPFGDHTGTPTFIIVNNKKIPVVGLIDVVYELEDGTIGIYDLKSNEKIFDYQNTSKLDETYEYDILQTVWYLKFMRLKGIVKVKSNNEDVTFDFTNIPDNKIRLFFDFSRFGRDAAQSAVTPVSAPHFEVENGRLEISNTEIPTLTAELDRVISEWVDTIERFQLDVDQPVESVFTTKKGKYCGTCPLLSICPDKEHVNNKARIARDRLLNAKIIEPPVVSSVQVNTDKDEDTITSNITKYVRLSTGKDRDPVEHNNIDINLIQRERKLDDIDSNIKTQIGTIYLTSTVIGISITDQKRHEINNTLRSVSPMVFRTEGTDKQIVVTIRFDSATKINTELRHILAQYIAFPFISIRNSEITRTVLPFDSHVDIYYNIDLEIRNLVQKYFEAKIDLVPDRLKKNSDLNFDQDTAKIKQEIYNKTRLFFAVNSMNIKNVSNQVDTLDLVMSLQMHNSLITSGDGRVEYLMDSNAVMNQLAWLYNSDKHVSINNAAKESLISILAPSLSQDMAGMFTPVLDIEYVYLQENEDYGNLIEVNGQSATVKLDLEYPLALYEELNLDMESNVEIAKITPEQYNGSSKSFFVTYSRIQNSNRKFVYYCTLYYRFTDPFLAYDIPVFEWIVCETSDLASTSKLFGNSERLYMPLSSKFIDRFKGNYNYEFDLKFKESEEKINLFSIINENILYKITRKPADTNETINRLGHKSTPLIGRIDESKIAPIYRSQNGNETINVDGRITVYHTGNQFDNNYIKAYYTKSYPPVEEVNLFTSETFINKITPMIDHISDNVFVVNLSVECGEGYSVIGGNLNFQNNKISIKTVEKNSFTFNTFVKKRFNSDNQKTPFFVSYPIFDYETYNQKDSNYLIQLNNPEVEKSYYSAITHEKNIQLEIEKYTKQKEPTLKTTDGKKV